MHVAETCTTAKRLSVARKPLIVVGCATVIGTMTNACGK
jgi:hypothetical protein